MRTLACIYRCNCKQSFFFVLYCEGRRCNFFSSVCKVTLKKNLLKVKGIRRFRFSLYTLYKVLESYGSMDIFTLRSLIKFTSFVRTSTTCFNAEDFLLLPNQCKKIETLHVVLLLTICTLSVTANIRLAAGTQPFRFGLNAFVQSNTYACKK